MSAPVQTSRHIGFVEDFCVDCDKKTKHRIFSENKDHVIGTPLPKSCVVCEETQDHLDE